MKRREFFKLSSLVGAVFGAALIPKDALKPFEPKTEFKEIPEVYPGKIFKASEFNDMGEAVKQLQQEVKKLK